MNSIDFTYLAGLLKARSGLIVSPDKTYLFETRLGPIARRTGRKSVDELISSLRQKPDETIIDQVVDAMTTNETSFFRDRHPFDAMRQVLLPQLMRQRANSKTLRIWSAACSTGQEAYSLAMMLRDEFPALESWKVEILGTDISPSVLVKAREATFSQFEVQRGLPVQLLVKHFTQEGERWLLKPELKKRVEFRPFNLLTDPASLGIFDVIFCRNVLIYFEAAAKTQVLENLHRRLAPDGALILGGSESVFGICPKYADIPGLRGVYTPLAPGKPAQASAPRLVAGAKT